MISPKMGGIWDGLEKPANLRNRYQKIVILEGVDTSSKDFQSIIFAKSMLDIQGVKFISEKPFGRSEDWTKKIR